MSSGPRFSADEDATIRDLIATHSYAQLGRALGRSRHSVRKRAAALGVRRPRKVAIVSALAREIAEARAEAATAPLYRGGWP